jgi:hypothetical protein
MKNLLFLPVIIISLLACNSQKKIVEAEPSEVIISQEEQDTTKYELIVFDPRYETYLISQAKPKWFYSESYYKTWNIQYVAEWNYRFQNPMQYGNFYETEIDYSPSEDYGLDLNYRLYQYFRFIEKEYGIVLISRRGKEKTR